MTNEKEIINPQAEGSNDSSGSKQKGKEIARISEVEINQQINNISQLIENNNSQEIELLNKRN